MDTDVTKRRRIRAFQAIAGAASLAALAYMFYGLWGAWQFAAAERVPPEALTEATLMSHGRSIVESRWTGSQPAQAPLDYWRRPVHVYMQTTGETDVLAVVSAGEDAQASTGDDLVVLWMLPPEESDPSANQVDRGAMLSPLYRGRRDAMSGKHRDVLDVAVGP